MIPQHRDAPESSQQAFGRIVIGSASLHNRATLVRPRMAATA